MCVFAGPADAINTTISCTLKEDPKNPGNLIHVVGYQNAVRDDRIRWSPGAGFLTPEIKEEIRTARGNAMILPFPSEDEMGPWNVIRLDHPASNGELPVFRNVLADQVNAVTVSGSLGVKGGNEGSVSVFDVGIYTVVMGNDPNLVRIAIDRYVPDHKRPPFRPDFIEYYHRRYRLPNGSSWQIAWCCFNTADLAMQAEDYVSAEPMLWWFNPVNPWMFFLPGLDAHDGNFPNEKAVIKRSHNLVFGLDLDPELIASMSDDRRFGKQGTWSFDGNEVLYRPLILPPDEHHITMVPLKDGRTLPRTMALDADMVPRPGFEKLVYSVDDFELGLYLPRRVFGYAHYTERNNNRDWQVKVADVVNGKCPFMGHREVRPEDFDFNYTPAFKAEFLHGAGVKQAEQRLSNALAKHGYNR